MGTNAMNLHMNLPPTLIARVLLAYMFFPIVLPNSLREFTIYMFPMIGFLLLIFSFKKSINRSFYFYFAHAFVTIIYIVVGLINSNYVFFDWVFYVYVVSPFVWLLWWTYIFKVFEVKKVADIIIFYGVVACVSVFLFFYLFQRYGSSSVIVFIAESNVEISDGRAAATMHVFGSLLFISGAILASPTVINNQLLKLLIITIVMITALISGRAALLLSVVIGLFIQILNLSTLKNLKMTCYAITIAPIFMVTLSFVSSTVLGAGGELDLAIIAQWTLDKILDGGGDARGSQLSLLIDGIENSYALGAGHGMGVEEVRNYVSPWKYELLFLSTLFHVGLIGLIVYLVPFLMTVKCFFLLKSKGIVNKYDVFFLGGFISVSVASNTNPYIESFDFQWMIIAPCVYFYNRWMEIRFSHPKSH